MSTNNREFDFFALMASLEAHIFRCFWLRQSEIISWLLLLASVLVVKAFIRSFLKTSWILAI